MSIAYFYPEGHEKHARTGHDERPERVETIRTALTDAGYWGRGKCVESLRLTEDLLLSIHTPDLLDEVRRSSARELDIDVDTYLTEQSWQLALNAAAGTAAVAREVWRGDADCGFALARPPGHHATPSRAMGFCLLNNVALAAQCLLEQEGAKKLAIIDMDVHHGNGTQDIFYAREDILFISTHQSPLYPGTGSVGERGHGKGEGQTVNIPLPPGSGDEAFNVAYGDLIPALLENIGPQMILVSFGFDSHWKDPLADLQVSAAGYGRAVQSLSRWAKANCNGRIALVLEGGYDLQAAAACAQAAASALLGEEFTDDLGPAKQPENNGWIPVVNYWKEIWAV